MEQTGKGAGCAARACADAVIVFTTGVQSDFFGLPAWA